MAVFDQRMNDPLVSIVVPVFNTARYLNDCFRSLAVQTYRKIEIIVVDDGSTDESPTICDEFAKTEPRCVVIHQKNCGLGAARDVGVHHSNGDWVLFVDSDDFISNAAVEICVKSQLLSKADIVLFPYAWVSSNGVYKSVDRQGCFYGFIDAVSASEKAAYEMPFQIAVTKFYRRKDLVGIRFSKGVHEDVDYFPRILATIGSVFCINTPLYFYRLRDGSITRNGTSMKERNRGLLLAWMSVLETSTKTGAHKAIPWAWQGVRGALSVAPPFLDDSVYADTLSRFSAWFKSNRKLVRSVSKAIYYEMKDVSSKTIDHYANAFRLSLPTRIRIRLISLKSKFMGKMKSASESLGRKNKCKKYKRQFLRQVKQRGPLAVVLPTPHHDNLGDHMIAEAMIRFYATNGYSIAEVPMSLWESNRDFVMKHTPRKAVIAIIGGGNIGTLWEDANQEILNIISAFRDNRVIVFPQTAFFSDDERGRQLFKRDLLVFKGHPNLLVSFRDRHSHSLFADFEEMRCVFLPDSALFGYPVRDYDPIKSKVALICFREDKESFLSEDQKREVIRQLLAMGYLPQTTSMHCGRWLDSSTRARAIEDHLKLFASASLVVCDTLHGMLFSWFAGTECVCFDNISKKVSGVHEWIRDYPWIHLLSGNSAPALPKLGLPISKRDYESFVRLARESLL